jgi:type IV secretory pathway VirB2 component (pilin)
MRTWLALIVAPLIALFDQAIAFALVGWACAHQSTLPLHLAHLTCLLVTLGIAVAAVASPDRGNAARPHPADTMPQRRFLARVAGPVATLAALAIVAMWSSTWMISPCSA